MISSGGKDFRSVVEVGCAVYGFGIGSENEKVEEVVVNQPNCLEAVQEMAEGRGARPMKYSRTWVRTVMAWSGKNEKSYV